MSQYAFDTDLADEGLPNGATEELSNIQLTKFLITASSFIDGYLANRYTLPLSAVPEVLKRCCLDIAAYDIITYRGSDPTNGYDEIYEKRFNRWWNEQGTGWLQLVAKGAANLPDVDDGSGGDATASIAGPIIASNPRVGWNVSNKI